MFTRALLLLALAGGATTLPENKKPAASPLRSRWPEIEAATGAMALDGTLRLSFPLGESATLKPLNLRFALEHRIEADAQGRARSTWRMTGLQSFLLPADREHLLWQPLAGAPVKFEREKIGRALSEAGSARWKIREFKSGSYEVRSLDGETWTYAHGVLVDGMHPALGRLYFETQGAWIIGIRQTNAKDSPLLLSANYDENGALVSLAFDAEKAQSFLRTPERRLDGWRRADGSEVRFSYRDGLLCEVAETGKPVRRFTWQENLGHERGDSRWAAPVHLSSDEANRYTYELSSKGFIINRQETDTGVRTVTIFNPRRHRIEQRTNAETYIVTFRGGIVGRGALEKIETGRGEILEAYRYDDRGLLVGVSRQGEPERKLSYDESGRLMALEEKP